MCAPRATDITITMLAGFFIVSSFVIGYMLRVWAGFCAPDVLTWAREHYLASGLVYFAASAACSALWYYTAVVYYEVFT